MTIAAAIAIIQGILAAVPAVSKCIDAICADVAAAHGLDPVQIIKAVTTPDVTGVDTSIDAEINTRFGA